jgi:hypothetical protein
MFLERLINSGCDQFDVSSGHRLTKQQQMVTDGSELDDGDVPVPGPDNGGVRESFHVLSPNAAAALASLKVLHQK